MEQFATPTPRKWYDRTWLVVVLCIFLFPVGLYALWKSNVIGQTGKLIGTAVVVGVVALNWTRSDADSSKSLTTANASTEAPAPKEPTAAEKKAAALSAIKEQEDQTVGAPSLLSLYKENEVRADKDFKGKTFYVEGTVEKIGKDIMNNAYVMLKGDEYGILGVQCILEDEAAAADLNKGEHIAIRGKCNGLMMNVLMGDASVVPTVASLKQQAKAGK
jgi:hypothetical protein